MPSYLESYANRWREAADNDNGGRLPLVLALPIMIGLTLLAWVPLVWLFLLLLG
ncbi:MAG: hypothetical protein VCD66_16330 [Alphaproteobacteria bacterium]|jgi:hypothetical protein